ncbi:hypothetical protein ACQRBF_07715 [Peptoniphilaceae bacterium SGI.131]
MNKIDSLDRLLEIKGKMKEKTMLRNLGALHKSEVIEIAITGNESESYEEIRDAINEIKSKVDQNELENCRFIFKDDPMQKEKFKVAIQSKIKFTRSYESLNIDEIDQYISKIVALRHSCGLDDGGDFYD